MQNTFQKMPNLQLEIALMSVQYQIHIFRKHNLLWKKWICQIVRIYIYIHGNIYNNIMRNSLQASRSLYILYRHVFAKLPNTKKKAFLEKYTISARNVALWSVVCCSLSKHSVKIIDESTFLVRLHYVLTCFVWKVAWPSHNHTNSCTVMQKLVKSDLSQLHPPMHTCSVPYLP
jgi:hypothetical protein